MSSSGYLRLVHLLRWSSTIHMRAKVSSPKPVKIGLPSTSKAAMLRHHVQTQSGHSVWCNLLRDSVPRDGFKVIGASTCPFIGTQTPEDHIKPELDIFVHNNTQYHSRCPARGCQHRVRWAHDHPLLQCVGKCHDLRVQAAIYLGVLLGCTQQALSIHGAAKKHHSALRG